VAALERENAALRAQLASAVATNSSMSVQLAKLNDRVEELLAVAQRKQRRTASPSENKSDQALVVEPAAQAAFDERPAPPTLPEKSSQAKREPKRTGRNAIPQHLEANEHRLCPAQCERCGGSARDVVDEVVEEKLHVVKERQRRRVVRRVTCRCLGCLARTTPVSLPAPYARSKVTCDWLAWLIDPKFGLLSPLNRIRRDRAEHGNPMAMGSLVNFVERAADPLAPIDGLH
jgi:hypothetical protein